MPRCIVNAVAKNQEHIMTLTEQSARPSESWLTERANYNLDKEEWPRKSEYPYRAKDFPFPSPRVHSIIHRNPEILKKGTILVRIKGKEGGGGGTRVFSQEAYDFIVNRSANPVKSGPPVGWLQERKAAKASKRDQRSLSYFNFIRGFTVRNRYV
jgi:hypothetical protein